jgi:hypothetical protein
LLPTSQFCCSYDLSRKLQDKIISNNPVKVYFHQGGGMSQQQPDSRNELNDVLVGYVAAFRNHLNNNYPSVINRDEAVLESTNTSERILRVFIPEIEEIAAKFGETSPPTNCFHPRQLARFLLELKYVCRHSKATISVSVRPNVTSTNDVSATSSSFLQSRLASVADTVITIDTFAGRVQSVPSEFHDFCGLLSIVKLQHAGCLVPFRPPGSRFGLKRDRRKLHVEPLHLPPEESRAFGSAGTDAHFEAKAKIMNLDQHQHQHSNSGAPGASSPMVISYAAAEREVEKNLVAGATTHASLSKENNNIDSIAVVIDATATDAEVAVMRTPLTLSLAEKLAAKKQLVSTAGSNSSVGAGISISSFRKPSTKPGCGASGNGSNNPLDF